MQVRTIAVRLATVAALACLGVQASAAPPQYAAQQSVDLTPSTPLLTAVDPYFNVPPETNATLAPPRPYWYAVDGAGLTILRISDNSVVYRIPWPATIDVAQPDGEYVNVPAPAAGWEPLRILVSYPTGEQLVSNSETPVTNVYVLMAHSGLEWRSDPNPPDLRSPSLRDTIAAATSADTESAMLVAVDVTDPTYDPVLYPNGPLIAAGIVGHGAGQLAWDPALGAVYVGNEPSLSLPTTPTVPNDLTSFVSVIFGLASPLAEAAEGGEAGGEAGSVTPLCGPEHPDEGTLTGSPVVWPCYAEGGAGPFVWEFRNLPPWLIAHPDKLTGALDGLLYGTPAAGVWTFESRVTDLGSTPPAVSAWTAVTLTVSDLGVVAEAEAAFEVGIPAGVAVEGTGACAPAATASPGSLVPEWLDFVTLPGRPNPNPTVPGGYEQTIGCAVLGTAPISGEYYEFAMPGFKFAYPFDRVPVIFSGQVSGPYMFTPVPAGVSVSGIAWHQIEKIHDPSTEADILNAEFFAVEPYTGQLDRILQPQGALEVGEAVAPPATEGELDEVSTFVTSEEMLAALGAARPDIGAALAAHPNLRVKFGDLVVEASANPRIYLSVNELSDPTGADPTVIPIGGPLGSELPLGALIQVTGLRDAQTPAEVAVSSITPIALPGVEAYALGLYSDLAPAIPGSEPGQIDYGVLWATGPTSGNVAVIDTALAKGSQLLAVPGASSLGGVAVNLASTSGRAYVAGKSLQDVTVFAPGTPPATAPVIWTPSGATFRIGFPGSFTVVATGTPAPALSAAPLPAWATFTSHGDGTATLAGTPDGEGSFTFPITASNGVSPSATQTFTLDVLLGAAPALTAVSPGTGSTLGGAVVTLTGTGFGPGATVTFGGVAGVVTSTSSTSLQVTAPAHAAGTVDVTVTNPDAQAVTLAGAFIYVNPPATGVSLSTDRPSPQALGTAVVFTATATGSTGYQYRFYAKEPGAASYTMVQDYGPANTWTLSTTSAGQWSVLVYVRTNPAVLVDKQAYKLFTLYTALPPATGVTLSTSLASPQPAGTPVVFTATGTGSSGYQYRFYAKAPGATSYSMVQDYGPASTWTLSTTTAGQWAVLVYVRTNPNVLVDAQAYKLFTIQAPPATGVTLTSSLASPQPFGTPVVFTATGSGSSGYQYRFYAKAPGATSYSMVRDYSATSTWTLPGSSAVGQWAVLVYVRTNPNVLVEAQAYKLFTIRAPPATGVTITTSLASPQPNGLPIVFTATGSGSSGYQYRFYAKAPGATSYAMVQEYSATNSWTLPAGSAAGQWSVLVYVRTSSNVLVDAQGYKLFTLFTP